MDDGGSESGTVVSRSIVANSNGTTYPLNIYLPPGLAAIRNTVIDFVVERFRAGEFARLVDGR